MIAFRNFALRRGERLLLSHVDLSLHAGWRIGVIGRNGCGKSSLFAAVMGEVEADQGDIDLPGKVRIASVAQETPSLPDAAIDFVLSGDTEVHAILQAEAAAMAAEDWDAVANAHQRLAEINGYDATARAGKLLHGLGFPADTHSRPVSSFSGGWRVRLNLARALMMPSDLLLLDEPTNHLDLDAVLWLEQWLLKYPGTLLMISHDREFLDGLSTHTLHLHEGRAKLYVGDYTSFERQRAEQLRQQQIAHDKEQVERAHLQSFIDRFKAKASKAKQAQSRVKALDRMEKIAPLLSEADFSFEFKEPANLPNPMLSMQGVNFGYPPPEDAPKGTPPTVIVHNVSKSVLAGQRIGILGANGQGKSTLVKTVARDLKTLGGEVTEGKGLNIGYFAQQELDVLRPDETPLEHMIRLVKDMTAAGKIAGQQTREQDLRSFLGTFNFSGDMVKQSVGSLSGGEKARLVLCMIVWQKPNLLLLDEPTNHLDLATREALSMALNEFEGTVMLVSHDRALLREVCDEFWLVAHGEVTTFDGDLDDYQRWLQAQAREVAAAAKAARDVDRATPARSAAPVQIQPEVAQISSRDDRKAQAQARQKLAEQAKPLKAELKKLDERLAKAHAEQAALTESLANPGLSAADRAEQGKRLKSLTDEVEALESRWLELTEEIEQLSA